MSSLKKILNNQISCKSIWFMRQAGRYLPEFRKIRSKNKNFIKLCLNSKLSSKITLQPMDEIMDNDHRTPKSTKAHKKRKHSDHRNDSFSKKLSISSLSKSRNKSNSKSKSLTKKLVSLFVS